MFSFDVTDFSLLGLSTISVDNKAVTKWLSCKDIKRILIWEISLKILFRLWPRKKSEIFRRVFIWQLTFSPLKSVILTHQISNPNHPRFQNRGRHFENFNDPALITQFFVNPTRDTDIFLRWINPSTTVSCQMTQRYDSRICDHFKHFIFIICIIFFTYVRFRAKVEMWVYK